MPLTEVEILEELIAPDQAGLPPEAARALLKLGFKDSAKARIGELLDLNNRGDLSDGDRAELEKYMRVGQFLDLLQAKARLSLLQPANPRRRNSGNESVRARRVSANTVN